MLFSQKSYGSVRQLLLLGKQAAIRRGLVLSQDEYGFVRAYMGHMGPHRTLEIAWMCTRHKLI